MAPVGRATVACVSGAILVNAAAGVDVVILVGGTVVVVVAAAAAAETRALVGAVSLCALPTAIEGAATLTALTALTVLTALTACKSPFLRIKLVNGAATEEEEVAEAEQPMEAAERPLADKAVCAGVVDDDSVDENTIEAAPLADEAAA